MPEAHERSTEALTEAHQHVTMTLLFEKHLLVGPHPEHIEPAKRAREHVNSTTAVPYVIYTIY